MAFTLLCMTLRRVLAPLAAGVLAAGLLSTVASPGAAESAAAPPALQVDTVRSGLQNPWAIAFLPSGSMLYTQREAKTVTLRKTGGAESVVLRSPAGMWSGGETGLMGIEVANDFATSRQFFTCHGYRAGTKKDVRVVAWRLNASGTGATFVRNLVIDLPSTSGRHGGCALLRGNGNTLYVGTGDAAIGKAPQSLASGGGKVLRINAKTGQGHPDNPYASSTNRQTRKIFTYGHRNVQGLALRGNNTVWSVEHGSYRDDEVNLLVAKGNYGWNPVPRSSGDPSYNEGGNSPMTDDSLPGTQRAAAWRSGDSTIAPSGATFVSGESWGELNRTLAMSVLKSQELLFLRFDASGSYVSTYRAPELDGDFGRLRAARRGPDGALYVTTSNGSNDRILRVRPRP